MLKPKVFQFLRYDKVPKNYNREKYHKINRVKNFTERITVRDTDIGQVLQGEIDELKKLVEAYKKGIIKEKYQ